MEKVLQKWLDHQCRMLQGSRRALLVTGKPRKGKFKRALYWPDDNYDHAVFFRVAQVAVRNKKTVIKTWARNSMISPDFVGNTIAVHNGNKFIPVYITENMVGHKLGEFAPTRIFRGHAGHKKT